MSRGAVVITGGGRGIGGSITRHFHSLGWAVIIGSRHDSGLAKALGNRAQFVAGDVRDVASHERFAVAAAKAAQLRGWINCAGFSAWRPVADVDESFWQETMDTNLKGTFWGCQVAASRLGSNDWIINISSLAGKRGSANNSVYCASKFGVNGITQALAKELGPRGIRVNAVCPVYVVTEGLKEALVGAHSPAVGKTVNDYLGDFAAKNAALGRLPTDNEVARTCAFLASDDAAAITGQCVNVDCGVLPQ